MKNIICALGAVALVCLGAGAANASTVIYHLTDDTCSGGCGLSQGSSYGTLTVSGVGTSVLNFDLQLTSGIYFSQASAKPELFSIAGTPSIDISNILATNNHNSPATTSSTVFFTPASTPAGHETPGNFAANGGIGSFQYRLDIAKTNNGSIDTKGYNKLDFTVTGASASQLSLAMSNLSGKVTNLYYAADLTDTHGNTGYVAATYFQTIAGTVPEPATWGMMIVGVAGVGGVLRRKRGLDATASVA